MVEIQPKVDGSKKTKKNFVAELSEIMQQRSQVKVKYLHKSGKYLIWTDNIKDIETSVEAITSAKKFCHHLN